MPCTQENGFAPKLPDKTPDLIYLCLPNNPTGAATTKEALQKWVDYANEIHAVLLFDAAYEAYITEENIPHSIYESEGAKTCAIEMRSFSKTRALPDCVSVTRLFPRNLSAMVYP